jgi:hypothetical protein
MGSRMWRAAAGAVAAAVVYKASGVSARTALRIPLGMLVTAAVGSVALQVKTAAKATGTEARLAQHIIDTAPAVNLVANGGTINGTVQVNGDHHVSGSVYGTGGSLAVGDSINCAGAVATTSVQNITLTKGTYLSSISRQGSVSGVSGYTAVTSGWTVANENAFWATGGSGGVYLNSLATAINNIIAALNAANIT